MDRIIIHVDMDAFYASVEIRDDPSLSGKPLIIGSLPTERGVVATCSYEARKYGVHSGMNIKEAYRLCPSGIYMHPNFEKYRAVSKQLHVIWNDYASSLESIALDEAYIDTAGKAADFDDACRMARLIKQRTKDELHLNCSVGIAYSKTAAKTASEEKKPDGYFEIRTPQEYVNLIIDRDVRAIYTVGEKTAERLRSAGIRTVRDVRENPGLVIQLLGKQGKMITQLASGIDDRPVVPYRAEDARSISREVTFQSDVNDREFLKDALLLLSMSVERRARRVGLIGNGVSLKLTYGDMKSISRSRAIESVRSAIDIYREAVDMLDQVEMRPVRLVGAGIYNLITEEGRQLTFDDVLADRSSRKEQALQEELVRIGTKYQIDLAGNIDKLFQGDTLYRTLEYMRKKVRAT